MVNPPPIPTEWGWFLAIAWLVWQLYAPKYFGVDTRFHQIVNGLNSRIDRVGDRLDSIESRQDAHVRVTEIIAVETDEVDGNSVVSILNDEEEISRDDVTHNSGVHSAHDVRDNGTPRDAD